MYRKEIKKEVALADIIQELEHNALNREQIRRKTYVKNELIEEDCGRILILEEGYIVKFMHVKKQEKAVDFYAGEELIDFDQAFVLKEQNKFTLKALTDCELITVDKQFFMDYLSIRPIFMEFIIKKLTRNLHHFIVKMGINGKYQKDRVMIGLLNISYALGADAQCEFFKVPNSINHYLLADYCDVDPTAFSKICKKLTNENMIFMNKRQIIVCVRVMRLAVKENQGIYVR
ncbi:hypothetical protein MFLO_10673 [Listeria floridensis FSL S10-1187]|uniref:Crp/Fnr family transcriptional regulator n=1 Tax=Listeria floridensis FSL S10-1187 TaxID=1265817 RepID=A0ABN0RE09_9LIST|nr:Crp/Fnr family transcriptional regulator [Listeria floridensis]EUJ30280.1 hypothetical protein MFLO_10673 [Listeria floridensis FSL S10-1187]